MAKVEFVVQTSNPDRGTFKKGETLYQARETINKWKLVAKELPVKIEFEWSKKDFPTFEEWVDELSASGYEKA